MEESRKKIILVIDDEQTITELIKLKLERSGFDVYTAADGIEGLDVLSRVKPDLIILDVLMPRMDGFQFYKRMGEQFKQHGIPILVLTARGAMQMTFEELGAAAFLVKPFEPEELLFRVRKMLSDTGAGRGPGKRAVIAGTDEKKVEFMRDQLACKGYEVAIAATGPEALGKALSLMPELCIIQFDMPEMDAGQIIGILDSHPGAEKISVMLYSIFQDDDAVRNSPWGHLLRSEERRAIRKTEGPLQFMSRFDAHTFLERIKDFL